MPANYDKLTRSEYDDERDEGRSAPSAQTLHGHAPIGRLIGITPERTSEPEPTPEPPPVRFPRGIIFERANLATPDPEQIAKQIIEQATVETESQDDDDAEDDDGEKRPTSQTKVPHPPEEPAEPQPRSSERIMWPSPEQDQDRISIEPSAEDAITDELSPLPSVEPAAAASFEQPTAPIETHAPLAREAEANQESEEEVTQPPARAASSPSRPTTPPPTHTTRSVSFNVPPTPLPTSVNQPPQPPVIQPPAPSLGPNPNIAPGFAPAGGYNAYPQQPPATHYEAPRPYEYQNTRDGFARALAFGAGVGAFIGGRRRKKLEKRVEQYQRQNDANFADLDTQQQRTAEQQQHQAQLLEGIRLNREQPLSRTPFEAAKAEPAPTYASQENVAMPPATQAEQRPPAPLPPIENSRYASSSAPAGELSELQDAEAPSINKIPEGRTVSSSWHEAVVDTHGNVIEGAKHYGRGFEQSRREVVRDRAGDAAAAGTAALAGVQQQQAYDPTVQYPGTLPSGITNPTLPPGRPTHLDPQHQLPAHSSGSRPGAIFWIMLAVIIIAFFAAALI